jgi:hypothetical protein
MDASFYGSFNTEFDFVNDEQTREYLKSAHRAISMCELWDWMSTYNPDSGFSWYPHPNTDKIRQEMRKDEINSYHSGASYALIMREMETIAKDGIAKYKQSYVNYN